MKVNYDLKTDTVVLHLRDGAEVAASDEVVPGLIHDYDAEGTIEILDASRQLTQADRVEFQLVR